MAYQSAPSFTVTVCAVNEGGITEGSTEGGRPILQADSAVRQFFIVEVNGHKVFRNEHYSSEGFYTRVAAAGEVAEFDSEHDALEVATMFLRAAADR